MNDFLPREVLEGLRQARMRDLKRKSRLCVHDGEAVHRILRFWETGFALDAADAPQLRGLVDIFDGARHLYQCLIVASEEQGGEMVFEFKRHTAAVDRPPLDFSRDEAAPVALIEDNSDY